jgi:hypothetical protein
MPSFCKSIHDRQLGASTRVVCLCGHCPLDQHELTRHRRASRQINSKDTTVSRKQGSDRPGGDQESHGPSRAPTLPIVGTGPHSLGRWLNAQFAAPESEVGSAGHALQADAAH